MIMKNNVIEYLVDSFVDFKGEEHKVIACAVSNTPDTLDDCELAISYVDGDYASYDLRQYEKRIVSVGYSICNPEDTYNEEKGKNIAYRKALKNLSNPVLCPLVNGIINKTLTKALLKQEVKFIKDNPERVIRGYNDSMARYEKRKKTLEEYNALSEEERNLVDREMKENNLKKYSDLANRLKNYNDQK